MKDVKKQNKALMPYPTFFSLSFKRNEGLQELTGYCCIGSYVKKSSFLLCRTDVGAKDCLPHQTVSSSCNVAFFFQMLKQFYR